jgi:hypothetical protein
MTFDDYQDIDALNFSSLKHILTSPAHYKAALETEVEETIDMRLGTAVHEYVLEGKVRPYIVKPANDPAKPDEKWQGNRTSCKAWVAEKKALGFSVYSPDEFERMFRMQRALEKDPLFNEVTKLCDQREFVVQGTLMGFKMKARLDLCGYYEGRRLIVDLKKCPDASPRGWGKTAKARHYDMQLCLYSNLLAMAEGLTEENQKPMVLSAVVEDSPAAPVVIFSVPDAMWESGMEKLERATKLLKQCRNTGEWPSYGNSKIIAPEWPRWNDEPVNFGFGDDAA